MQCPACRGETPDDKPFCANCGAGLAVTCVNCGAELLAGKPFCADCGTPVATHASPTVASTAPSAHGGELVAERRLCSVLFVDLVGFTPLAEHTDPEAVRELLSRVLRSCRGRDHELRRHDREVHRRRGDGRVGRAHRQRGRRRAGRARRPRRRGRRRGPRPRGRRPCARLARGAWSPGRSRSPSARCPREWCSATPSTPPRGCRGWRHPARCWSMRPRGVPRRARSPTPKSASSRSRARPTSSPRGRHCASSGSARGSVAPSGSSRPSSVATTSCGW